MSIEIVKINKKIEPFSIWIDTEQGFNLTRFLKDISLLGIKGSKKVHQAFGPAEIVEKYSTRYGVFHISIEFDELAGVTIYSDSSDLMKKIYNLLLSSGKYCERQKKHRKNGASLGDRNRH